MPRTKRLEYNKNIFVWWAFSAGVAVSQTVKQKWVYVVTYGNLDFVLYVICKRPSDASKHELKI